MRNIEVTFKGNKMILEVDVAPATIKAATPSGSGKTLVVATTAGNKAVKMPGGGEITIGLTAYVPKG